MSNVNLLTLTVSGAAVFGFQVQTLAVETIRAGRRIVAGPAAVLEALWAARGPRRPRGPAAVH